MTACLQLGCPSVRYLGAQNGEGPFILRLCVQPASMYTSTFDTNVNTARNKKRHSESYINKKAKEKEITSRRQEFLDSFEDFPWRFSPSLKKIAHSFIQSGPDSCTCYSLFLAFTHVVWFSCR